MTITRDKDYPPEIATLFVALNSCAEGYASEHVVEAAFNLLVCAINFHSPTVADAADFAEDLAGVLQEHVVEQWGRKREPTEVVVKHGH